MLWGSVGARALPASKTDEELARKHTKTADAKQVMRQHLPVQSVCCVFYKKCQQRKEMETIPQCGQPLLVHICLSWDSGYKSGRGGGGTPEKEDWKRGQLLYLEFVARKQKSC